MSTSKVNNNAMILLCPRVNGMSRESCSIENTRHKLKYGFENRTPIKIIRLAVHVSNR
jgi:hypothetical protein